MHFKCDVKQKKKEKSRCIWGVTSWHVWSRHKRIFTLPIKVTLKLKGLVTFSSRSTKQSWCNGFHGFGFGSSVTALHLFSLYCRSKPNSAVRISTWVLLLHCGGQPGRRPRPPCFFLQLQNVLLSDKSNNTWLWPWLCPQSPPSLCPSRPCYRTLILLQMYDSSSGIKTLM